ncbi:MAG: transposase [candidate division WOR-3 bacterium]|nr:transposase [candidate division WOR-3 bacterium]
MPRIARGLADGFVYHVLNRGNGKQQVFHKEKDYDAFLYLAEEAKTRIPISIFAYCVMPNHFHFVVMPERGEDLSRWMQWFMTSHVRRYHGHYRTCGHVWQGRFKSFIAKQDEHLINLVRYVEGNPVRAGLVTTAADWRWSSHSFRIAGEKCVLTDELPVHLPENWGELVDEPLPGIELEQLRTCIRRQGPYGDEEWRAEVCRELGIEITIRPRGRPKKK